MPETAFIIDIIIGFGISLLFFFRNLVQSDVTHRRRCHHTLAGETQVYTHTQHNNKQ